jgi:hypothetical protein
MTMLIFPWYLQVYLLKTMSTNHSLAYLFSTAVIKMFVPTPNKTTFISLIFIEMEFMYNKNNTSLIVLSVPENAHFETYK